jgi:hypothetical protein
MELERLQRIVIGDARFVYLGLRQEGGFVGKHDRVSGAPIADHISAAMKTLPGRHRRGQRFNASIYRKV